MSAKLQQIGILVLTAALALLLLAGCGDNKKKAEIEAIDAAIAENESAMNQFYGDSATFSRAAEGFAKGYEGDIPGIARDVAATHSQAEQLAWNDRQLRAYRQELVGQKSSWGFSKWVLLIGGVVALRALIIASNKSKR